MIAWPWESSTMLERPWVMWAFMGVVALAGSVITWVRWRRKD